MTESSTIRWERGEDGIVILTLDDPNQSANTMNAAYLASISGSPMHAVSAATRISQDATKASPPPSAAPLIAAITGFWHSMML